MVKVRLSGLPADVEATARVLRDVFVVLEESRDYVNRNSEFVRRYVTIEMPDYPTEPLCNDVELNALLPMLASEKR